MNPIKEIGECLLSFGDEDYFLRPSFANMSRIGDPEEIVQVFYHLHSDEITPLIQRAVQAYGGVPAWLIKHVSAPQFSKQVIYAAMSVIQACCDVDASALIGELRPGKSGKWAMVYKKGALSVPEQVIIARSLIAHGIIGKAKVRKLQRNETGERTTSFVAFEYINAARSHFGISRDEAEKLTMTEFQMMMAMKYPDQKGFTREEYDKVADDYLAKRARRLAKAA